MVGKPLRPDALTDYGALLRPKAISRRIDIRFFYHYGRVLITPMNWEPPPSSLHHARRKVVMQFIKPGGVSLLREYPSCVVIPARDVYLPRPPWNLNSQPSHEGCVLAPEVGVGHFNPRLLSHARKSAP